jgi:hypothetical protein
LPPPLLLARPLSTVELSFKGLADNSRDAYRWMYRHHLRIRPASHTGPSDYVLELPYGGGLNFASRRPNPIFDTMLFNMQIPPEYQRKDLERIEQRGPALIVAQDAPRLGTNFSFGIAGNRTVIPRSART